MKHVMLVGLVVVGFVSVWLLLWDFIDWLTTGLNDGVWDNAILINGLPSILAGLLLLLIIGVLGVKVIK